jgi:isopenicillin-N epimerase
VSGAPEPAGHENTAPAGFGRQLLPLWHLEPEATHLNHGSFGACPREVLAAQRALREEMERAPDQFFRQRIMPGGKSAVREAAHALAAFVGTSGERIALVENATSAVAAVLARQTLKPGDEILIHDHAYNAVRLAVEQFCRRTGAQVRTVELPIPIRSDDIVERIAAAAGPGTRLAILDHITSPTALTIPITEIIRALKAKGVRVLIDGAHAVGQVPLALDELGADWYTSNAHKWLFAPKGTALLYARPEASGGLLPLAVSHFNHCGFPEAFDYVGTRDVTGWLALAAAIAFTRRHGQEAIMAYNNALSRVGTPMMARAGAVPVGPDRMAAAMRAYHLPQRRTAGPEDAATLMAGLWQRHRIQIAASCFKGQLLLRISAQIYVEPADIERLCEVLTQEGWPGR